jgi:chromate transporter
MVKRMVSPPRQVSRPQAPDSRLTHPLIARVRKHPSLGHVLDGVNVAALGLMAGVTALLAREAIVDLPALGAAIVCGVILRWHPVNTVWIIGGGAALGLVRYAAG